MMVGNPIYPPPAAEASEATYAQLTAELRARVVEMWEELRAKQPEKHSAPGG
jgi:TRAP-type C4-dicarboxylate transport system substrate-binding protein